MDVNRKSSANHWDLITLTVLSLYFLAHQEPLVWAIKGLSILTLVVVVIGLLNLIYLSTTRFIIYQAKWIISSIILIFVYLLLDFGDFSDMLSLLSIYAAGLMFYIAGSNWGLYNKKTLFGYLAIIVYFISLLNLTPYVILSAITGNINKQAIILFYGSTSKALIMFWPYFFIIGFWGFFTIHYGNHSKSVKWLAFAFFIIFILAIFVSSFMAIFMMFVFATMAYYYLVLSRKNFFRILIIVPAILFIAYNFLDFIASSEQLGLGETSQKTEAFLKFLQPDEIDRESSFDQATGYRWQRINYSTNSFLSSPLYGKGYYKTDPYSGERIASNHSSIFDGLAWFGLFYLFILFIYFKFLKDSYLLTKLTRDSLQIKRNAAIFAVIFSFVTISFFNPYLQFPIINVVFFLGGWANGQLKRLEFLN